MNIYIDIETIPSGDKIDPATLDQPKAMKKEETIAKWREEEAPKVAEELYRKRALKSMEGEIICICWAIDDGEVKSRLSLTGDSPGAYLLSVSHELKESIPQYELITWVGHNILTFDMPWIWRRAVKYDLHWLRNNIRLDYRGNIEDTLLLWRGADRQDYTSLDDLARWLGVGEPIGHGSEVYDLYLNGEYDKIIEHCKQDVNLTRKIYKKIKGEV